MRRKSMISKLIEYEIDKQIQINENSLKLLNIKLDYYESRLKNAITNYEKRKYQKNIDNILCAMDKIINNIGNI